MSYLAATLTKEQMSCNTLPDIPAVRTRPRIAGAPVIQNYARDLESMALDADAGIEPNATSVSP